MPSFLAFRPLPQIHQVYEMMQRWDPVASSLSDVVQRLLTLRELHEQGEGQGKGMLGTVAWCDKGDPGAWGPSGAEFSPPFPATQFGQVLVHLDTTQQEIAGALKDNTVLLAEASLSSMCWGGRGPHPVPPLTPFPTDPPAGPEDDEGKPGHCRGQLC